MAENRRGDKIGGSGFSLRCGPDIGLLWCKLQLPVPAPWPPVSFRQTPLPCHPRTHPWTEYQGGVLDLGASETLEEKTSFPVLLALACRGTPPGGAGPGVKVLPSAPTPSSLESLEAAGAPVHSPKLQFLISAGAAGGGRGLQGEREDLNEKAGCVAPRPALPSPARWGGGVCWLVGDEVPFWGAFQTLDRVLELEPQESVTHHPSTLEVAPVPRTPKNPSSAEPSKLSRSVLLGETRKKRGDWFRQPRCAREQVAELLSAGHALRTVCALCVGTPQASVRRPGPRLVLGSHLSEGRGCVSARKNLILGTLAVVGGVSPGGR